MSNLPKLSDLHAQDQQSRIEFLKTDLALCFTFADIVHTEFHTMDDRESASAAQARAEAGYETISRLLVNVDESAQKDAIQQTLTELRSRLDGLQVQLTHESSR